MRLLDKIGEPDSRTINIRLTHQDIANLVASSRETASLHMSDLKKNGIIAYDRRCIRILSTEKLLRGCAGL
jgi:CRP-like cAMP-binding protein